VAFLDRDRLQTLQGRHALVRADHLADDFAARLDGVRRVAHNPVRYFNNGSRGRPRIRSAMVLRVISDVPPAMVIARDPR
jgi:hypothetical protein